MLTPEQIELVTGLGFLDVIQIRGTTDLFGHGYFVSNPRASADLIAMLRYGLKPNEPGRPLVEVKRPFWRVISEAEAKGCGRLSRALRPLERASGCPCDDCLCESPEVRASPLWLC